MEKEFVPYELAIKLKELGYNDECFGFYSSDERTYGQFSIALVKEQMEFLVLAPLWQQAFDWFREEYGLFYHIKDIRPYEAYIYNRKGINEYLDINFKLYEEARLACLKKLIELIS